jgi:NADH-quinone oxidoreductase subunit A
MTTIDPYVSLLALMVFIAGFVLTMLFLSVKLGPSNVTVTKEIPFECGGKPVGNVRDHRFNVKFYLVAMLFILFDIEIVFMYPWAVNIEALGWNGLISMFSFMFVLALGLVYVWKRGVFRWND